LKSATTFVEHDPQGSGNEEIRERKRPLFTRIKKWLLASPVVPEVR
jgi:hypothetical protein